MRSLLPFLSSMGWYTRCIRDLFDPNMFRSSHWHGQCHCLPEDIGAQFGALQCQDLRRLWHFAEGRGEESHSNCFADLKFTRSQCQWKFGRSRNSFASCCSTWKCPLHAASSFKQSTRGFWKLHWYSLVHSSFELSDCRSEISVGTWKQSELPLFAWLYGRANRPQIETMLSFHIIYNLWLG